MCPPLGASHEEPEEAPHDPAPARPARVTADLTDSPAGGTAAGTGGAAFTAQAGEVRPLHELRAKLGVPEEEIPGHPVFTDTSGEFMPSRRYHETSSQLRRVVATHYKNKELLEKGEKFYRRDEMTAYFNQHAPAHLRPPQSATGREQAIERKRAESAFVDAYVAPWATQARIAEEIYDGFDELIEWGAPATPAAFKPAGALPVPRGRRATGRLDLARDQAALMERRTRIRSGFVELRAAVAAAFKDDTVPHGLRATLGRFRPECDRVLGDYKFKIGDRNWLLAKNDAYAAKAAEMRAALEEYLATAGDDQGLRQAAARVSVVLEELTGH